MSEMRDTSQMKILNLLYLCVEDKKACNFHLILPASNTTDEWSMAISNQPTVVTSEKKLLV